MKAPTTSLPYCRPRRSSIIGHWVSGSSSTWCGRRCLLGTTWIVRLLRRRTRAPTASAPAKQRPYLAVLALLAAVSFVMLRAATFVTPAVASFSLPTRAWQSAAGGLVTLTAGQWRRLPERAAAIVGWAGLGVILLACTCWDRAHPIRVLPRCCRCW